jgi:hypothetical protein
MHVLIAMAVIGCIVLGALGDTEAWIDGCILVAVYLAVEQLEAWYVKENAPFLFVNELLRHPFAQRFLLDYKTCGGDGGGGGVCVCGGGISLPPFSVLAQVSVRFSGHVGSAGAGALFTGVLTFSMMTTPTHSRMPTLTHRLTCLGICAVSRML